MNILLEGIFYNGHGLAEGNRMLLRILDRAGYRVRIIARDQSDRNKVLSPEEIDYISSFENTTLPSNDLYIFNWVGTFVNYNADFRINIARTTFETDRIPRSWVRELNKFKEVWVQSKFNKHTFASSGVDVPLKLIPNFFDIKQFNPQGQKLNLPISESFTFLSVFDLKKRKGYDVLLRAFLNEFSRGDDVALVIKIRDSSKSEIVEAFIDKHPKARKDKPAVYIIDQMLETKELLKLYRTCDTFVLPTRGEGWGRPFFEAMLMEMPVIGTNWSGHTDFMVKENSFLVDVKKLVKIDDPENALFEGHYWAEPSLSDLQKKMRLATKTNKAAKEVARNARLELLQKYSTHETSRKVIREIAKYEKG
mgnify:CR=1 FL=1